MRLSRLGRDWESLAKEDPYWAVLSDPTKIDGGWDEAEFFQTGSTEIDTVLGYARSINPDLRLGAALDFGCGPGRLTHALSAFFEQATGVDVSPTMIDMAQRNPAKRANCAFRLNTDPDLHAFDDDSFDFVYSRLVLQHMPPRLARGYIAEFVRVLRPGGLLIFQVPVTWDGRTLSRQISAVRRELSYRIKARRNRTARVRMYSLPVRVVERDLSKLRARLIEELPDLPGAPGSGWTYVASKD
jgi:SAM-dependent methyltransferase